jgi:hypothetical protein
VSIFSSSFLSRLTCSLASFTDSCNEPWTASIRKTCVVQSFLSQPARSRKMPQIPESTSELFTAGLCSRTLLETNPPTIQIRCLQPGCLYAPKPQPLSFKQTKNYWTHFASSHPDIYAVYKTNNSKVSNISRDSQASSSHASDIATLFAPRITKKPTNTPQVVTARNDTYRALLLDFVVSNNLALRIADSAPYKRLISFCDPTIITISTTTLERDLDKTFLSARNALRTELQEHINSGGRISITTDTWSARNYKEFIAVTGHWINKDWKQRSQLLDIIHLEVNI